MEIINLQSKRWQVVGKIQVNHVHDGSNLKEEWKCDMVAKNQTHYFMVDEIIDIEFEDLE